MIIGETIGLVVISVIVAYIVHYLLRNLQPIKFIIISIVLTLFAFFILFMFIEGDGNTVNPIYTIPGFIMIFYHGIKLIKKRMKS